LNGEVVGISDGDTITILKDKRTTKIRLYGIDCPEKSQDFSKKAKSYTSDMVFRKKVKIISYGKDRYGRTIGLIYLDSNNQCLNEELIKSGYAWVYVEKQDKMWHYTISARMMLGTRTIFKNDIDYDGWDEDYKLEFYKTKRLCPK